MTNKQKTTLILFAQNYSLPVIAKNQKVCLGVIRKRIKTLSKNYPSEFNNAIALRYVYKRNKEALKDAKSFKSFKGDISIKQIF